MGRQSVLKLGLASFAASLVGCDYATKMAARSLAVSGPVKIVDDLVQLRYVENDDVAFSLLHNVHVTRSPLLLALAATFALAIIGAAWIAASQRRASTVHHIGYALVVAGAIGNVADRLVRGRVIDFIAVWRWPVFNVADVLVVVGMFVLGYAVLAEKKFAT